MIFLKSAKDMFNMTKESIENRLSKWIQQYIEDIYSAILEESTNGHYSVTYAPFSDEMDDEVKQDAFLAAAEHFVSLGYKIKKNYHITNFDKIESISISWN